MPAYQNVSRARTELNIASGALELRFSTRRSRRWGSSLCIVGLLFDNAEHIPRASARVQKRNIFRTVNLPPQTVDVNFDKIRKRVELFVPHVFRNFGAPDNAIRVAHEKLQ